MNMVSDHIPKQTHEAKQVTMQLAMQHLLSKGMLPLSLLLVPLHITCRGMLCLSFLRVPLNAFCKGVSVVPLVPLHASCKGMSLVRLAAYILLLVLGVALL